MQSFSTTAVVVSEIDPDVRFTIRKFSAREQAEWTFAQFGDAQRLREMFEEVKTAQEGGQQVSPKVGAEIDAIYFRLLCAKLKRALVSVEGIQVDGKEATVDQFIESAPAELLQEAAAACEGGFGLTSEQQKN